MIWYQVSDNQDRSPNTVKGCLKVTINSAELERARFESTGAFILVYLRFLDLLLIFV